MTLLVDVTQGWGEPRTLGLVLYTVDVNVARIIFKCLKYALVLQYFCNVCGLFILIKMVGPADLYTIL